MTHSTSENNLKVAVKSLASNTHRNTCLFYAGLLMLTLLNRCHMFRPAVAATAFAMRVRFNTETAVINSYCCVFFDF